MKISLSVLFVCFIPTFSQAQSNVEEGESDALVLIDEWLEAQQAYDHLPGISAGIVKDQKLIWSKGYGVADLAKRTPASPSTLYSICSITKLFTSIAIMQLYEQGKLRLDDSIQVVLPEFNIRQQFADSGPITIRSLLTHSSGLPRESDFPYWTGPDYKFPTRKQVTEKLDEQETLYPASTYFQYSNLGMTILGEIVEKVSGKKYDDYVEENILDPLRLSQTFCKPPTNEAGRQLATGYSSLKRDGTRDALPVFDTRGMKPAAGFYSTVEDLARFAEWQFRLLDHGGKEIIDASTLKEMQRVHWVDPDWKIHWGLGFVVYQQGGKTLVGHSGSCPGYRTTLLLDPQEKMAFIVMINAMQSPWPYATQMRNIFLKGKKEMKSRSQKIDLNAYEGVYNAQPWGSEKKVLSWYGNLAILDLPTDSPLEDMTLLQHVSGDVFRRIRRDEGLGEKITFERDANTGKVIRMWENSNYSVKLK
ncbi:MAG TPA: serine hydrolase domain-containing protein [Chryseosolibacter sp.]|nr:serine hydrolase domain-containing protein [Chryseosolibacter sp.]